MTQALPIAALVRLVQFSNAPSRMLVTLLGIETLTESASRTFDALDG